MKKLLLPFLSLLCLVNSCADNENILESKVASYDVYVAGKENNMACY